MVASKPSGICLGCDRTWYGLVTCHCSICHESFSLVAHFDAHRAYGKCRDPGSIKITKGVHKGEPRFKLNAKQVWVGAGTSPHAKDEE